MFLNTPKGEKMNTKKVRVITLILAIIMLGSVLVPVIINFL